MGVQAETVFAFLRIEGVEDITLEHLATLFGLMTAIKEGDTTPEQAFAVTNEDGSAGAPKPITLPTCSPDDFEKKKSGWKAAVESGKKSVNDLIAMIQTKEQLTNEQRMEIASWEPAKGEQA
jgi:hypothetical protein